MRSSILGAFLVSSNVRLVLGVITECNNWLVIGVLKILILKKTEFLVFWGVFSSLVQMLHVLGLITYLDDNQVKTQ